MSMNVSYVYGFVFSVRKDDEEERRKDSGRCGWELGSYLMGPVKWGELPIIMWAEQ